MFLQSNYGQLKSLTILRNYTVQASSVSSYSSRALNDLHITRWAVLDVFSSLALGFPKSSFPCLVSCSQSSMT